MLGKIIDSNFIQLLNAYAPMLVTEFDIVTFANVVQPLNAFAPMLVILGPIVTFTKVVQLTHTDAAIVPT